MSLCNVNAFYKKINKRPTKKYSHALEKEQPIWSTFERQKINLTLNCYEVTNSETILKMCCKNTSKNRFAVKVSQTVFYYSNKFKKKTKNNNYTTMNYNLTLLHSISLLNG